MTDWNALFAEYQPIARRVARSVLGDRPEVDDACQRVWYRLITGGTTYDPTRGGWQALIVTMARSEARALASGRIIDRLRVTARPDAPDPLAVVAHPAPTAEATLVEREQAREQARSVRSALADLPPRQRQVVALRAQSLTTAQIGERLGLRSAAVVNCLIRARRRLRRTLSGRVPLPPDRGRWGLPRLRPSRDGSPNPRTSAGNGSPSLQASVTD